MHVHPENSAYTNAEEYFGNVRLSAAEEWLLTHFRRLPYQDQRYLCRLTDALVQSACTPEK
jgi:hypothetical protein